jgi:hypothetical protein
MTAAFLPHSGYSFQPIGYFAKSLQSANSEKIAELI